MSDCTHELEDLLVEVFESLATDGPILPEHVARKLHGMVHLHRLCSHRYSSDFVGTSCLECGEARRSNQADSDELTPEEAETDVEVSAVLARPELVVEDAPAWIAIQKQNEHPELLIECDSDDDSDDDDGFVPRSDWASSQDHPEIVIELEGPPVQSAQPKIVIELEHEPSYMAALTAHPELVIEMDATPVTATETCDEVSHVNGDEEADDVAEMQSPSFLALPAIEEEDVETCSVASMMDALELAGKPLVHLPSVPQSSETLSMHSDDETVTSVDLDLENIQSLNNEYDEFFEFMNQQLEPEESPDEMPSPRAAYTPTHSRSSSDASDSEDDDHEPLLVHRQGQDLRF
ncbi:hypothetical protein SDRG_01434 [Saprolegnia diclina VS20]|uniref:Uncharacterized protein n=1 Tax=Saprolegnia diclina (strain VS20) TaxID=1156394 RepID=T0SF17_SAPDV|nr:hypothetical protein SDRG_01434 [Saprolegnia diclina VS20]EQC41467.1 hypothetical protein SDRG_01434 [Saprolegnia diclina VS20]|eukprot:XP_008605181.1 hypothetical protein SDRG_01434 [Saprolegnia diclina VS20]